MEELILSRKGVRENIQMVWNVSGSKRYTPISAPQENLIQKHAEGRGACASLFLNMGHNHGFVGKD